MTDQLTLHIESGPAKGRSIAVEEAGYTVGRQAGNDLVLDDGETSRRHARFDFQNGFLTVTDLGSANGTTVNGQPIAGPRTLAAGDTVQIGTSTFRIVGDPAIPLSPATVIAASPPPVSPPPPPSYTPAAAPPPLPPPPAVAPSAGRSKTLPLVLGIGGAILFLCVCLLIAMSVLVTRAGNGAGGSAAPPAIAARAHAAAWAPPVSPHA